MFAEALQFNADIREWGSFLTHVTDMTSMFLYAKTFNQDVGPSWGPYLQSGCNIKGMFHFAEAFDQDLSGWGHVWRSFIGGSHEKLYMFFLYSGFSEANYAKIMGTLEGQVNLNLSDTTT